MARILLGVSGGIAAYKALELVRLATGAGHAVRSIQTPASQRLRRRGVVRGAHRRARPHRRVRARPGARRVPRPGAARPRPAEPPRARPQRGRLRHRARRRRTRSPSSQPGSRTTSSRAPRSRRRCPLLVAPAMNHHMWEHPATRANVATLRARGVTVLEPDAGRLASKGEWGAGRLPEPASLLAAAEALLAPAARRRAAPPRRAARPRHRRRDARADRRRPLPRQPLLRPHGLRARRARPRRSAPTSRSSRRTSRSTRDPRVRYVDVETAAGAAGRLRRRSSREPTSLLMAAAVVDFRPPPPFDGKLKKADGDELRARSSTAPRTSSPASRPRAVPGQTLVGFAAEHGDGRRRARARQARAQGPGRDRRQRHLAQRHRLRRRRQRGDDRHRRRRARTSPLASKAAVARAVLDAVVAPARRGDARETTGPAA